MDTLNKTTNWRIAAAALLCLTLGLYWAICSRSKYHPLQAVPSQTGVVLSYEGVNPVDKWLTALDDSAQTGLSRFSLFKICREDAAKMAALFQEQQAISEAFQNKALIAAFSLQAADSLHPLFVLDIGNTPDLKSFLAERFAENKVFSSNFQGRTLYTIHLAKQERIVVCSIRNLLIFSRFSYLVEDALVQLGSRGQWWMKRAYSAGSKAQSPRFQILIRPEMLAERWRGTTMPLWNRFPEWLAGSIDWVSIYYEGGRWQFKTGLSAGAENLFARGETDWPRIFDILPDNTAFLGWARPNTTFNWTTLSYMGTTTDDYQQFIKPWAGNEAALAVLEPLSAGMLEDRYIVIEVKDSLKCRQALQQYGRQSGFLKQYDYQTFEVSQFLSKSILSPMLRDGDNGFRNPVCAVIDRYLVFAATTSAMELWIDKNIVHQTLANQPDFLQARSASAPPGNVLMYLNTSYLPLIVKNIFGLELPPSVPADLRLSQNLGLLLANAVPSDDESLHFQIHRQTPDNTASGASLFWKLPLDGEAISKPSPVVMEQEEKGTNILIQDSKLRLYRISTAGNVVWAKQLDQPVISEIRGIDYFNNGKTCFLFNTSDAIWILDEDGKEIAGFPLKLQSLATNGVSLVDFDGNHKYALFVACANGNLYGLDQFGRPLPGWNPQSGVGRIKFPLVYFKSGTKDYLSVLSLDGRLSVFNRDGSPHFPPVHLEGTFAQTPLQFDANSRAPRLVCMNTDGRAFVCGLDGQTFGLQLAKAGKEASTLAFSHIFGDQRKDYSVLNDRQVILAGYDQNVFKRKYHIDFKSAQDTLFDPGCCAVLGTLDRSAHQLWLLDNQGRILPDFPLAGTTAFCLCPIQPGRPETILVAGNGSAVYAYKIGQLSATE